MREDWQDRARELMARQDEARYAHPHGTWAQRWIPGVCKHDEVRCVHGEEIIARNWRRVACLVCSGSLKRDLPEMCWFSGQPHDRTAQ